MKPVEVNVNFLYHLETSKYHRFFMFSGGTKGNIDPGLNSNNIGESDKI